MLELRFVELLAKELTDGLTFVEKQEYDLLLQQNPAYRTQSTIIKEYWKNDKSEYKASKAGFKKVMDAIISAEQVVDNDDNIKANIEEERRFRLWPALKYIAAIFILSIGAWSLFEMHPKTKPSLNWQTKITPSRIISKILLSDSTVVTLNAGTTFKYPHSFGDGNREVFLNGEAFFEVHKDAKHPFIIHTNKMNVRVLGTAFNVKSYSNEAQSETSLIHGSIEVTLNDRVSDRIILKPHEKLIVKNNSQLLQTNKPNSINTIKTSAVRGTQYSLTNITYFPSVDSAAVETLWLKKKLVFKNKDFETIAGDMSRWYGIQIVFEHEALKRLRFTATFMRETPSEAFESMRFSEDFHFKKKGSIYYILN